MRWLVFFQLYKNMLVLKQLFILFWSCSEKKITYFLNVWCSLLAAKVLPKNLCYTFIKGTVLIHFNQYFIERGPYRSERETTLEILETGHVSCWPCLPYPLQFDKRHPGASATPSPLPLHAPQRALTQRKWARLDPSAPTWPWDLEERATSVRFAGDLLPLGDTEDLHHQQEAGDHQQGLGEVSK
jgi:hypothetical protein